MKRIMTVAVAGLMLLVLAVPASAQEAMPEHGHILLLHMEYDDSGEPVGYGKCIDVAGGRRNSHAHHSTIHQGRAGKALGQAGHMVVPTAHLTPWRNCAEFAEALASGGVG